MNTPPKPTDDYYFDENGLLVFTAKYLSDRGFCCKNGCRHCPYGERRLDDEMISRLDDEKKNPIN